MNRHLSYILVTGLCAALVAVAAPPAQGHHRPNAWCSRSGDICQTTFKIDGVRKLQILVAARYFRVFHLCVLDPDGYEICRPYELRRRADGTFGRSVRWRADFPGAGPGPYTVSWWDDYTRIGRVLGFHVRR